MAASKFSSKPHADLLLRVFDLPGRGMTRALAESILAEQGLNLDVAPGARRQGILAELAELTCPCFDAGARLK
jgi:hypothetical protein